jgi:hypothetical protein
VREQPAPGLPDELREAYGVATELRHDQRLLDVLAESRNSIDLRREATRDPRAFLKSQGIEVPESLTIRFGQRPLLTLPGPDFEWFSVRLFDCRTYWIWVTDPDTGERKLSSQEVCWGFEILPRPVPGGPIGGLFSP